MTKISKYISLELDLDEAEEDHNEAVQALETASKACETARTDRDLAQLRVLEYLRETRQGA